jgi:ketosteroid isomerase-like protein
MSGAGMGMQENIDFAKAAYTAMAAADLPWMAEHTHPDVVFKQGGRFPTAGTYNGRDAMFGHFMEFMTLVGGDFALDPHDYLASDERVAVHLTVTIGLGGRRLSFEEVHLWRIVDGLLVEMHAIPFDPYEVDDFFTTAAIS